MVKKALTTSSDPRHALSPRFCAPNDDGALVCVASKHPGDRRWARAARFGLANARPWRQLWSEVAVIRRMSDKQELDPTVKLRT